MTQPAFDLLTHGATQRSGLRDRVLLLRGVENLEGLDQEGFTLLAEHARSHSYRKGDVVTPEGVTPEAITIVLEGCVAVTRPGKPELVVSRGRGFGILAVMAEVPTSLAVAVEDTIALQIPVAAFRIALEENFSLLRNSLRIMGTQLARARHNLPADPKSPPVADVGVHFEKPRTLAEQLIELRKGPFVQMNIDALVDLTRRMKEQRVPAGHVFWRAGDPASYALHVEYGRVRCTAADGQHVTIGHDFTMGVMDVWGGLPRSYEARAETDVIAYRAEYEDFLMIMEMHVSVGLDMLRGIARQYLASGRTEVEQ